ncbi:MULTISPECIES: type I polyketide synthase [unclassified Streptomyces]|uniref:type I polyketide synthase n=1 Tax=unclassified Streptomyces TaxID=2593676 RepID=UPI000DACE317|nr:MULTISPECIES: type I polyketide synthase [unclassified Streptomyces]PZT75222.1 beta keto-acyl synthase [Streptomyces sp. AC1-42T]PZT84009.1 beta keto-acyl synthase [Streptomyces sp. AC1-42W]
MPASSPLNRHPVAVVGVGALVPGASDAAGYWRIVSGGRDLITEVPASRWRVEDHYDPDPAAPDRTYARRGAFLPEVDFDPMAYGVPPTALSSTDSAQLLALMVADQVLADAGGRARTAADRTGVVLGAAALELLPHMYGRTHRPVWLAALRESGLTEEAAQAVCDRISDRFEPWRESSFPGLLGNVVAGRIANRFDLHGINHTTDAACASSLAALSTAAGELALGRADLVISGGVDTGNDIGMFLCFSKTPALSPSGDCRPFSADADGTMLGEAVVMYALKRLADAERDGDRVHAVIRGIGSSSDGRGGAIYAPMPAGQARALRRAYEDAGYGPETVELVEAHGTGTKAGDTAELASLSEVFGASGRGDGQWCAVGSVKSQIGHTKCAAGAAGLLKAVMALRHQVLPPTVKVVRPNPAAALPDGPFYVNTETRPWVRPPGHPRRASVSSFGFGGSNFHVTLEEYVPSGAGGRPAPRHRAVPSELVLFGGESPASLVPPPADGSRSLAALARESQLSFSPTDPVRLAIVATGVQDLREKFDRALAMIERRPDAAFTAPSGVRYACGEPETGRVAFLFPGQGAQYVGMGAGAAMLSPAAQAVWDRLGGASSEGRALHRVVFPPPAFTDGERAARRALLDATEWAQPALAVQSLALLAVVRELGLRPDCVAGHSFGELVALHCAGALDAGALVDLARRRGELMRDVPGAPGAMLAVAADRDRVAAVLAAGAYGDVWPANHNAPRQVVLSGTAEAVARAERAFADEGVDTRRLAASTAFHSPLVAPATEPFAAHLRTVALSAPGIDVYGNADAAPYPSDVEEVRGRIAGHLASPVLFQEQIEAMYAAGVRTFIEIGAGNTLTALTGRILGGRPHTAVSLDGPRTGVDGLHAALGELAVHGVPLDLGALWAPYESPETPAKEREPRMTVKISGGNDRGHLPPPRTEAAAPPGEPVLRPSPPYVPEPEPKADPMSSYALPPQAVRPAGAPPPGGDLYAAVDQVHRQTAETHAACQQMLVDSHLAFLRMTETSMAALLGGEAVAAPAAPAPLPVPRPAPPVHAAEVSAVEVDVPRPAPAPEPVAAPVTPAPVATAVPAPAAPPAADAAPVSLSAAELKALLLSVVARLTGYPAEMIDMDMELEADLGVDSIKRVEILSAVRREVGDVATGDVGRLGRLRTLREIVDTMAAGAGPAEAPGPSAGDSGVPEGAGFPGPDASPREEDVTLTRLVPVAVESPASGPATAGLLDGPVVVTGDGPRGAGLSARVARRLAEHGVDATASADVPSGARAVVHLGALTAGDGPDGAREVLLSALRAARTVAARASEGEALFVAVQDTGGDFGLGGRAPDRAWLGGVAGLVRTAAKEWPDGSCRVIDCEWGGRDDAAVADAVVRELLEGGADREAGLRADGSRVVPRLEPRPLAASGDGRITSASVIVATGGARGVTAAALLDLARAHRPRIVLVGRTDPAVEPAGLGAALDEPSLTRLLAERAGAAGTDASPVRIAARAREILAAREVRATLAALEAAGSPVRYVRVDARDGDALADALRDVREAWGPVTGIVHGAGVLADRRIADKSDEQAASVLSTKVDGLRALLAATADDPLDTIILFSSVAAVFGNPGQCDYAMANEVLHQVASAEQARRPDCLVRCVAWGPWQGGMVTPSLAAHFDRAGVALIPLARGAAAFTAELAGPAGEPRVIVVAGEDPAAMAPDAGPVRAQVPVRSGTLPQLVDHAPADVPVLPVALALNWLAGAGAAWLPAAGPLVVRELRVYRTCALPELAGAGHLLTVLAGRGAPGSPSGLDAELRGEDGTAYYRAVLEAGDGMAAPDVWETPEALKPLGTADPYEGTALFHGPRFQVLRTVSGVSEHGAEAVVAGLRALDWPGDRWALDAAAADGALQLALLWAQEVLGARTLPMAVAECRVHLRGLVDGEVRCVVRGRKAHDTGARCDAALIDPDGRVLLELIGVELVRRPS